MPLLDYLGREIPADTITKSAQSSVGALDREFFFYQAGQSVSAGQIAKRPYQYNPWIFAAAYTFMVNISQLHFYMYMKDKPKEHINDHEVLDALRNPHPLLTRTTFIQSIILNLLLSVNNKSGGQCFIVCDGKNFGPVQLNKGEIPLMFTPVGDRFVKPEFKNIDTSGISVPIGWRYDPTGRTGGKVYNFNEIIRIYQVNPYDMLTGVSNEETSRMAIAQDIQSDLMNESLYKNMATPSGVLKTEQELTRQQKKDRMAGWYDEFSGPSNNFKTAILDKGLEYKAISRTNAEMQFVEGKQWFRDQIISAFHINKIAIGDYEKINKATIETGRRMLWHDAYKPLAELILEAINTFWVVHIEKGLRLGLDYSIVEALRDDFTEPAKSSVFLVKSGMPPVEAWKMTGLDIPDDWIKKYPWITENPLTQGGAGAGGTGGLGLAAGTNSIEAEVQKALVKKIQTPFAWEGFIEKTFEPGEKDLKSNLIIFLNGQRNRIQDNLDRLTKGKKASVFEIDARDLLPDAEDENSRLRAAVTRPLKSQVSRDLTQLAKEGIEYRVNDPQIEDYIATRAEFLDGMNSITFKKVLESVNDVIKQGVKNNETVATIAHDIKTTIGQQYEFRKNHAATIARTEIGAISSDTRFNAMKDTGVEYVKWSTAQDERVRESHQEEDGNVVKIGDAFPVTGLVTPCENGGDPAEVINCRCVLLSAENPDEDNND